jgi:hypothetical protein
MATNYKILGQTAPGTTSNADLYTVPASTQAIVSTLVIANTSGVDTTFRIFVRKAGVTAAPGNAIAFDTAIVANSQVAFTLGLTLSAADVITVQSSTGAALSFHAFGSELD